jgi:hypothetical protein
LARRSWEYSADTTVAPDRVLACITDFSDRRPDYWPGLSRSQYKVLERGDTWTLVREGTAILWAVERYDWSAPGLVRWTLQESNLGRPGTVWEMRVSPRPDGGSHVAVHFERDYKGVLGLGLQTVFDVVGGDKVLGRYLRRTLDILERESSAA